MADLVFGAVQMNSTEDKPRNLENACTLLDEAVRHGATFAGLPEYFNRLPSTREAAEPVPGPSIDVLRSKAREHGIWLHAGSIMEYDQGGYYNTSVVIAPGGEIAAKYRKIHLFDVHTPGQERYKESDKVTAGTEAVVFESPWGVMGLTICYDLRFGELYRAEALAGATVIWCPSAFTLYTGKDHWEVLIRARAIENQLFMVCPAQIGATANGATRCFGSALVADPWGTTIARAPERECVIIARPDLDWQQHLRRSFPVLDHRRPSAYQVSRYGLAESSIPSS